MHFFRSVLVSLSYTLELTSSQIKKQLSFMEISGKNDLR